MAMLSLTQTSKLNFYPIDSKFIAGSKVCSFTTTIPQATKKSP
ncbi:hypothetical protein SAMN02745130_03614 [Thiothrix eikelboomii]|uniref:Uncharacterized protein n=1 Tax=Thiothrix eikelboomii TaxID=92487 RepID=A0A1T4XWN2_9GAMM|nr:hypothetical protein SAMN02745130_03614 [Thiothrix eikelboomii]